ncbi:hypothetical protein BpHYR1_018683 [Brachionus plicatilis]|uniref:Uncharacterized protein n=1 Tax=Brachionus plicatilis TaxID=10195 RepID=A0A3M7S5F0_BRAPC|nr:hypothetical protein BpHYR1_018683 [Brachionus plicatilis]
MTLGINARVPQHGITVTDSLVPLIEAPRSFFFGPEYSINVVFIIPLIILNFTFQFKLKDILEFIIFMLAQKSASPKDQITVFLMKIIKIHFNIFCIFFFSKIGCITFTNGNKTDGNSKLVVQEFTEHVSVFQN